MKLPSKEIGISSFTPEYFVSWLSSNPEPWVLAHVFLVFSLTIGLARYSLRNIYLYWAFTFIGTLLHEICHMMVSIFFGKFKSISLLPKQTIEGYTLGSVTSSNLGVFSAFPVAMAPLAMVPLFFFLFELSTIQEGGWFTFMLYVSAITLYSSIPSSQDFRVALSYPVSSLFYLSIFVYFLLQQP
jgi:hypothetical protein